MKILLDENLPTQLKDDFSEYEIFTVRDMKWLGKTNGELLKLMLAEDFSVLITGDKNLQNQQNFTKYPTGFRSGHVKNNLSCSSDFGSSDKREVIIPTSSRPHRIQIA